MAEPSGGEKRVSEAPEMELVSVGRGGGRDAVLVVLVIAGVFLALLKPWGATAPERPVVPGEHLRALPAPASPSASPPPLGPLRVPETAIDPDPAGCLQDVRWHVCLLGDRHGHTLRNVLDPNLTQAAVAAAPAPGTVPVIVVLTTAGAGLAFYAPPGATAEGSHRIALSAWRDEGDLGARSIMLKSVVPVGPHEESVLPANVFVSPTEPLVAAHIWPTGRYVFSLQGPGLNRWQEYFAIDVLAPPEAASAAAAG